MTWNNNGNNYKNDPKTKMFYGIMKELQRANALKALELKATKGITADDVDAIMDSDPGRIYRNDQAEETAEDYVS